MIYWINLSYEIELQVFCVEMLVFMLARLLASFDLSNLDEYLVEPVRF